MKNKKKQITINVDYAVYVWLKKLAKFANVEKRKKPSLSKVANWIFIKSMSKIELVEYYKQCAKLKQQELYTILQLADSIEQELTEQGAIKKQQKQKINGGVQ